MKRILAMLLSVICVLSFTCVSTYADEKSEDEEKAASIAESYLSAAAKNMWLYESNNLAEHTIQELVDTSGNSLLSDMSTDVNTQKILSSMDNITFVQEKSKYFREMRQRQDIQRNDFALEYAVRAAVSVRLPFHNRCSSRTLPRPCGNRRRCSFPEYPPY